MLVCVITQTVGAQPRQTAASVVAERIGTETLKKAMLAALNQHPEANRWSGVDDKHIFGISVVAFTDRDERDGDVRMFRVTARLTAAKEMLFAKVLLDKYAETGLTNAGFLREAVAAANESFAVTGRVTYNIDETFISGNQIVGIVVADRNKVVAIMTEPARIDTVRIAYREVVQRQSNRLIADQKYDEALQTLLTLRQARLFNREHLLDVLRCFIGLDRANGAERIVQNLIDAYSDDLSLYHRLVTLTNTGKSDGFRELTHKLQTEIDRLDPPGRTAEEVLNQLLNELSEPSQVPRNH
jgi:hypothetical protein